jgi:hypothetical protein
LDLGIVNNTLEREVFFKGYGAQDKCRSHDWKGPRKKKNFFSSSSLVPLTSFPPPVNMAQVNKFYTFLIMCTGMAAGSTIVNKVFNTK